MISLVRNLEKNFEMQSTLPTLILRHRRENLKKCSLSGLETVDGLRFFRYPEAELPPLDSYLILSLEGPILSQDDSHLGLLLIDATWRYAKTMLRSLPPFGPHQLRSLPSHFRTAYPRRQPDCDEPERGLASVEALYIAHKLMGRPTDGLLNHYYWADQFLDKNSSFLS